MTADGSSFMVPNFYQHLMPRFAEAALVGRDWITPLALFKARDGFGEELWIPSTPETTLALRLSGAEIFSEVGPSRRSGTGGNFALSPAGLPNHYRCQEAITFVHLYLSNSLLDRAADAAGIPPVSGRLRDDLIFVPDARLEQRLRQCARSAFADLPPSRLEMEAHTLLVLDALLALHDTKRSAPARGGLAPWHVARVTGFLEASLGGDPRLAELAALVDLSVEHFCRAFKVSTGLPPHAWLIQRRVERARELLERTRLTVEEIASQVGYAEPSHLARLFRRAHGVSPSEYRRSGTHDGQAS